MELIAVLPIALAHAPKLMLPLLQRTYAVDAEKIINILKSQMDKMNDGMDALRTKDLKVARQKYLIGLQEIDRSLRNSAFIITNNDEAAWRNTLEGACEAAQNAYTVVPTVEEKIECFKIMYTCTVMIDSPSSACIKIRVWINELCNDETIAKAMKEFKRCVEGNRRGNKTPMRSSTKELLASFFTQLSGAINVVIYLSDRNNDCEDEKGQIAQLLRKKKNLYKATSNVENIESMTCCDGLTLLKVAYYATAVLPLVEVIVKTAKKRISNTSDRSSIQRNEDPAKEIIIETGLLLHLICHSDDDPNFNEYASRWLERIDVPLESTPLSRGKQMLETFLTRLEVVKSIPISTILKKMKNQLLIQKQEIVDAVDKLTRAQKAYVSLFASFSCFGFFFLYSYGSKKIGRGKTGIFGESLPALHTVTQLTRKILSNKDNTRKVVAKAIDVVSEDLKSGGGVLLW